MRRGTILWLVLTLLLSVAVNAATISNSLQNQLNNLAADESIQAFASFRIQADLISLDQQLKMEHATLADRNRRVLEALQSVATQTQPEMSAYLDDLKAQGLIKDYRMYWISNIFWVETSRAGIEALASHPALAELTYNFPIENIEPVKIDPADNLIAGHEIGLERINATAAWAQGWTGAGRVVMNIDTGVDGNHPALADRFRGDVDEDGDVDESWYDPYDTHWLFPQDSGQHGTHTMGTICGRTASGDTIGVAIDAQWIASAAVDRGGGIPRTVADILLAFQWAADPDGNPNTQDNPDAIGNSWGIPDGAGYPDCDETFWSVIDNVELAGSVVVFSAGNEGANGLRSPADRATTYYNCFSVGAVDGNNPNLPPAYFTALGPTECASGDLAIKPEVTAPGVNVRSSIPGGGYTTMSGTSMSSPHVTGSVAIIRQVNPDLDVDTIKEILMSTAHDLPFNNPDGEDNTYGHGVIDVYEACLIAQSGYGYVMGTVMDEGGTGIGNALVEVVGAPRFTRADDDGNYLIGLPADTTYTMRASFFGYIPSEDQAAVVAEDTTFLDFTLSLAASGSLHGTVTSSEDSSPIEGANVYVDGAPIDPVQTDQNGYYIFSALPGENTYTIRVTATGFGVGMGDVFVPVGGDAELDFALDPFESFENDNAGWMGEGIWEWGEPTSGPGGAYDGNNVWATVLGGEYPNNADASLMTIPYAVEDANAVMTIYQWYNIENSWDGGNVSISTDGGNSWTILYPTAGYPDDSIVGLDGEPGFTNSSSGWEMAEFPFGDYIGQIVNFRFRFGTDGSVTRDGWYLDAFVASGATPVGGGGDPHLTVNPNMFSIELMPGNSTDENLNIGNTGDGMLYYTVAAVTGRRLRPDNPNPDNNIDPFKLDPNWGKYLDYQRDGDMLTVTYNGPKDIEKNGTPNPPMTADFGGPDEFGYFWIDSNEPNGPTFEWVDITGIGSPLSFGDDENQGPFDFGFEMPFYENTFSSINICSNGWLSFTSTYTTYSNVGIPNSNEPNCLIAPFWDDLDPGEYGMVYFYTNGVDSVVVEWDGVPHFPGNGSYTFEAILTADGNITFQYLALDGELASNTIGIEDYDGSIGLEVAYNTPYATDGLAVLFKIPTFWLYVDPVGGAILPDESVDHTVTFDATDLDLGTYTGYLRINSNDPNDPTYVVPCTLNVVEVTGIDDNTASIPSAFGLDQNYPNPFNPTTDISFALPVQSDVEMSVFDMLGRKVKVLVNGNMEAGYHTVTWDGTDSSGKSVSSGIYFYSIEAGDFSQNRKMIMLK